MANSQFTPPPRQGGYRSGRQTAFYIGLAVLFVAGIVLAARWFIAGHEIPKRTEFHSTRGMAYSDPTEMPAQASLPKPTTPPTQAAKAVFSKPKPPPVAAISDPVLNTPAGGKNEDSGGKSLLAKLETSNKHGEDGGDEDAGEDNALSQALKRTNLGKVSKARVDRNYLYKISAGRHLACNRTVTTNSQLPGFVTCDLAQDVFNDDGTIPLLPKGTHVFGEYKSAVLHGNNRLFVLWTTIRTNDRPPIKIDINSPAADQLGSAGMTGVVNEHFWETFFATAVYTLLEAIPSLATSALQSNSHNSTQFQYNQYAAPTEQVGGRILQERMNRPPVLESNPGEPLMIFVGNDIDLSGAVEARLVGAR